MIEDTLKTKVTLSELHAPPSSPHMITELTSKPKPTCDSGTTNDDIGALPVISLTEPDAEVGAELPVAKKAKIIHVEGIIMGQQLSDVEINFAYQLLKEQFPKINGLISTLYQEKKAALSETSVQNKLQIVHCRTRHHWIVASTSNCSLGEVKVYNSFFYYCDEETNCIIANLFQCGPSKVAIKLAHSQKQKGCSDCGLFAIAFATAVAYGINPSKLKLKQEAMRPHLINCFNKGIFHCFHCVDHHEPR